MLIAKMFGVAGTAGLTLALCRRARAIFWAAVGAMCMIVMKRTRQSRIEVKAHEKDLCFASRFQLYCCCCLL